MSNRTLRAAALQLCSQGDVQANLEVAERGMRAAAARGANLLVLPENFAWFGSERAKSALAETVGDFEAPIQGCLSRVARELAVTVVAGGMPEKSHDAQRPYNSCIVMGAHGELLACYRKLHLFDVELPDGKEMHESEFTSPGDLASVVVELEGVKVGLSVCYDLRFPELYRCLVAAGAEVIVVPSAFTLQTGKDHWHVLLRARAIESTAWVVAANQWGSHPRGRACYGHSLIVDPWGVVVAESSEGEGAAIADLDLEYLDKVRARLPSLQHRRL